MKKRVMLCAKKDWANLGRLLEDSLRSCGVDADMYITKRSKLVYEREGKLVSYQKMLCAAEDYDIVQFMHSGRDIVFVPKDFTIRKKLRNRMKRWRNDKLIVMFHGGSFWRKHHDKINDSGINKFIDGTIIQSVDLLNLGAKNEKWVMAPTDVDKLTPRFSRADPNKIVFGHYPTIPYKKNSALIVKVMSEMEKKYPNCEFQHSFDVVPYKRNMRRIKQCDVYIEQQAYTIQGKTHGEIGLSAQEAAALGKIVVASFRSEKEYADEYGDHAVVVSNSEEEFRSSIERILLMTPEEILRRKKQSREWIVGKHSFRAIGKRMIGAYENMLEESGK